MMRTCTLDDFAAIHAVINDGAQAYKGVIPADCWHEPYMSENELRREIDAGIRFSSYEVDDEMVGVMGVQPVRDVCLIRHAYVRTAHRRRGIGGALLGHACAGVSAPVLIGTWADAVWAIHFYEKHGFRVVSPEEKERLLTTYWTVPPRQRAASVVLGDRSWFERRPG